MESIPWYAPRLPTVGTRLQYCTPLSSSCPARWEQVWVYPSQQMFYNAMKRKGWTPSEDDMAAVVAIHNAGESQAGMGFGVGRGGAGGGAQLMVPLLLVPSTLQLRPQPQGIPQCLVVCVPSWRLLRRMCHVCEVLLHSPIHSMTLAVGLLADGARSDLLCAVFLALCSCLDAVNERAWREIMRWEAVHGGAAACGGPRLVKFRWAAEHGWDEVGSGVKCAKVCIDDFGVCAVCNFAVGESSRQRFR